jgi:hypothetical protein
MSTIEYEVLVRVQASLTFPRQGRIRDEPTGIRDEPTGIRNPFLFGPLLKGRCGGYCLYVVESQRHHFHFLVQTTEISILLLVVHWLPQYDPELRRPSPRTFSVQIYAPASSSSPSAKHLRLFSLALHHAPIRTARISFRKRYVTMSAVGGMQLHRFH